MQEQLKMHDIRRKLFQKDLMDRVNSGKWKHDVYRTGNIAKKMDNCTSTTSVPL
jgi:hypothetical protein